MKARRRHSVESSFTPLGKNPNQRVVDAEHALEQFVNDAVLVEKQKIELEARLKDAQRQIQQLQSQMQAQLTHDQDAVSRAQHEATIAQTTKAIKEQASREAKLRIEEAKQQWRKESKEYAKRETEKLASQYEQELARLKNQLDAAAQPSDLLHLQEENARLAAELQKALESTYTCPLRLADLDRVDGHVALQNHSNMDVSLAGWTIHAPDTNRVFEFPDETMIAAGASVSVWWGSKNSLKHGPATNSYWWPRCEVDRENHPEDDLFGETQHCVLQLMDAAGNLVQELVVEIGLSADGSSVTTTPRSRSFSLAQDGSGPTLVSPYHRSTGPISLCKLTVDPFSVVIRNDSAEQIDLSGWRLKADVSGECYTFSSGRVLPPSSGYRVISDAVPSTDPLAFGSPGTRHVLRWSGKTFVSERGDILVLQSNTGLVVCSMVVPAVLQPQLQQQHAEPELLEDAEEPPETEHRISKRLHHQFSRASYQAMDRTERSKRFRNTDDGQSCIMS